MAKHTLSVTDGSGDNTRLPDWSALYLILITMLRERGWLGVIARGLKVRRQGGYVGLDIFAFLLAMFCWARPDRRTRSIHAFSDACSFCRNRLAAVAGRRKWPTQSAVSRFLSAVPAGAMLLEVGAQMLRQGVGSLVRHPDAQSRDTLGQSWHVFDFDPTILAMRQRALPEGEDLPEPKRRVADIAAAGYTGRKRGEVLLSVGALQHAGTGLWLQLMVQVGNASVSTMLGAMLGCIKPWLAEAGAGLERAVVRADGAAGNVPSLNAFVEHGVDYVTRLAWYSVLEREEVRAYLDRAPWVEVPDSGSGPRRHATEVGSWPWRAPMPQDAPQGMDKTRLVVTRFAADTKHGAGRVQDGWQYELFATSLSSAAWPARETVELYYGRCGQENRFAQVMAELGLDKLFSTELGGHWLVVLVGLFSWNQRTILGAERAAPLTVPEVVPEPRREVSAEPKEVAETVEVCLPTELQSPREPEASALSASMLARLAGRNWAAVEARHPGWKWLPDQGLSCPVGKLVWPGRLRAQTGGTPMLIFRTFRSDCATCPQETQCYGGGPRQSWPREVAIGVAGLDITQADLARPVSKVRLASIAVPIVVTAATWQTPTPLPAGPLKAQPPRLVPSVFRAGLLQAVVGATAHVTVHGDEPPERVPQWRATTPARRQRRRLTWTERLARNALGPEAQVSASISALDPWLVRGGARKNADL